MTKTTGTIYSRGCNYNDMGFTYDVNRYTPKQMVIIPLILLVLALISIGFTMSQTGLPVKPGIDFSGGTAVTVFTTDSAEQITDFHRDHDGPDRVTGETRN